jgi:hypothetical protein
VKTTTKQVVAAVVFGVVTACASAGCNAGGKSHGNPATGAAVGTTVLAGSLVEARAGHQAVAVEDGDSVLIVGGETLTSKATSTAELWRAGRSVPLPVSMLEGREGHRAVTLPSGEVWIVGGRDVNGRALATTELYDPQQRAFRRGPNLRAPRAEAAVVYTRDEVLFVFGQGQTTIEGWRLDLSRSAIVQTAATSGRRAAGGIFADDGTVYVAGGIDDEGRPALPVWVDLKDGAVKTAPGRPHSLGEHHVQGGTVVPAALDGATLALYVVGGTFNEQPFTKLQRVRPDDTEFNEVALGLLTPRERATYVTLPRGFLVAGGLLRGQALGQVEAIAAEGSSVAPSLTIPRYDAVGTRLRSGSVLITGGRGQDGLPIGVSELVVPTGVAAPDAASLFALARAEKAELDRLIAERDLLLVERDAAFAKILQLEGDLTRTRAELTAAQTRIRDLEAQLAAARTQIAQLQAQLAAARQQAAALQVSQAQTQAQLDAERARSAQLQAQATAAQQAAVQAQQAAAQAQQALQAAQQAAAAKPPAPPPYIFTGTALFQP